MFFKTYYPKVMRFGTGAALSLKSRLKRRHTESSASWLDEHDTGYILQDYTKLNDNTHVHTTFPSNGKNGPHPVVSTTFSGHNSEHNRTKLDDETNAHNGILKTVRVDQDVQYG